MATKKSTAPVTFVAADVLNNEALSYIIGSGDRGMLQDAKGILSLALSKVRLKERIVDICTLRDQTVTNMGTGSHVVAWIAPKAGDTKYKRFSANTKREQAIDMIDATIVSFDAIAWDTLDLKAIAAIRKAMSPTWETVCFYTDLVEERGLELANKTARRGEIKRLLRVRFSRKLAIVREELMDKMFPTYRTEVAAIRKATTNKVA